MTRTTFASIARPAAAALLALATAGCAAPGAPAALKIRAAAPTTLSAPTTLTAPAGTPVEALAEASGAAPVVANAGAALGRVSAEAVRGFQLSAAGLAGAESWMASYPVVYSANPVGQASWTIRAMGDKAFDAGVYGTHRKGGGKIVGDLVRDDRRNVRRIYFRVPADRLLVVNTIQGRLPGQYRDSVLGKENAEGAAIFINRMVWSGSELMETSTGVAFSPEPAPLVFGANEWIEMIVPQGVVVWGFTVDPQLFGGLFAAAK